MELFTNITFNSNGYEHLSNINKVVNTDQLIELFWNKRGVKFSTKIDITNKEFFICQSYDNPSSFFRNTIILRSQNTKTVRNEMFFNI